MTLFTVGQSLPGFWDALSGTLHTVFTDPGTANGLLLAVSHILQFLLPLLAILILVRCGRSLLQGKIETEVWGFLVTANQEAFPTEPLGKPHRPFSPL